MTTVQETPNKATFRRAIDATNSHDRDLMSRTFDEIFDPKVLIRTPLPVQTNGSGAIKEVFTTLLRAFPDLQVTIDDLIEEEDKVVARQTVTGTHQGAYLGVPPTGKRVTYDEIFVVRFLNGRIAETWGVVDVLSQMKQLGVIQA
jgi:steroid delta-isomerase-like uncharacterized protein